jgi:hypothetical protein
MSTSDAQWGEDAAASSPYRRLPFGLRAARSGLRRLAG